MNTKRSQQVITSLFKTMLLMCFVASFAHADPVNPSGKGPHDIGFISYQLPLMPAGVTTVNVWYPIGAASVGVTPVEYQGVLSSPFGTESVVFPSPLGATQDAQIEVGSFPMVVQTHGGGPVTAGDTQGLAHTRNQEILASHGLVAVSYTRRNFSLRSDTDLVIASVLSRFPTDVDGNNIGIAGESFGSRDALSYGAGVSLPQFAFELPADPRVKAILVQDAGLPTSTSQAQLEAMTVPLMLFSGSLLSGVNGAQALFNDSLQSLKKYHARFTGVSHLSFASSSCDQLAAARAQALLAQFAAGVNPPVEPLTTPLPPVFPGGSVSGLNAFFSWNFISVSGNPALGQASEFCAKAGVDNSILSSDLDGDGTNDQYTGVNASGDPVLPAAEVNDLHARFATAFWKFHLSEDNKYKRFLHKFAGKHDDRFDFEVD